MPTSLTKIAVVLASLAASASAQQAVIDRATMLAGSPVVHVGMDDSDNGFRANTPLLLQSDKKATVVDCEDLARRTAASYENGVVMKAPVSQTVELLDPANSGITAPPPEEPRSAPSAWLLVIAAGIVTIVAIVARRFTRLRPTS